MRKGRVAVVVILGALIASPFALQPARRFLLSQSSCFAFAGVPGSWMRYPLTEPAPWLRENVQLAVATGAVERPSPPFVIISRTAGDAEFSNVIVATRAH